MNKPPTPPKHLTADAKRFWGQILRDYATLGDDPASLRILRVAAECIDTMETARKEIASKGLLIADRFNQSKQNPACAVLRDSRASFLQAVKALGLDPTPET